MLLHPVFTNKAGIGYFSGVVITVACQIGDRDQRIREGFADKTLDVDCCHGHGLAPNYLAKEVERAAYNFKSMRRQSCCEKSYLGLQALPGSCQSALSCHQMTLRRPQEPQHCQQQP